MNNECIFCKLAAGEIPSFSFYEDDDFKVIFDLAPATKGHALIIPKKHAENLFELEDELAGKALILAKKLITVMKEVFQCEGFNILQNNGQAAGQTVFHFHIHLIPRYNGNKDIIYWNPQKFNEEQLVEMSRLLKEKL